MYEKLKTAAEYIQSKKATTPRVGIILGSGLGAFVDQVEEPTVIPYNDIPFFGETTVEGHAGQMILGKVNGVDVAILQGRYHVYEGLSMDDVVFPTRVLATLGIESLVLTNASGGINLDYKAGDLVIIEDHINMMGRNPLIGENNANLGPRFPDMSFAYNNDLNKCIEEAAKEINYPISKGVYVGVLGPTYETPAEIKMFRTFGADMVGMSTVPESIAANHMGIKVCGVSCITNMAAGIEKVALNHEEVKEQALKVMETFSNLLKLAIKKF